MSARCLMLASIVAWSLTACRQSTMPNQILGNKVLVTEEARNPSENSQKPDWTPTSKPVEGLVIDRLGRPAAGVEVFLTWRREDGTKSKLVGHATTDKMGFFSIAHRPLSRMDEETEVFAYGSDGAIAFQSLRGTAGGVLLCLPPVSTVVVTVVDSDGKPLPGRKLRFSPMGGLPTELEEASTLTSGPEGSIRLTNNADKQLYVSIPDDRFDCYGSQWVNFPPEGQTTTQVVKLQPISTIVGRVLNAESGAPMSGVQVQALMLANGAPPSYTRTTDALGHFEFRKIQPGSYSVYICDRRYGASPQFSREGQELSIGATIQVADLKTFLPGQVRCVVRDRRTHEPLGGQSVHVQWKQADAWGFRPLTRTFRDGIATIIVQPGNYNVIVNSVSKPCLIKSGETVALAFDVAREPADHEEQTTNEPISGQLARVVDPEGHSVPFAVVEESDLNDKVLTDSHGFFDLGCFNDDARIRVSKGRLATKNALVGFAKLKVPVLLKIQSDVLGTVSGRVVDSSGHAIVGAVVDLMRDIKFYGPERCESTTTDKSGRFSFSDLWPDEKYQISASTPGSKPLKTDGLVLKAGETKDIGNLKPG